jgi:hypothetical protein
VSVHSITYILGHTITHATSYEFFVVIYISRKHRTNKIIIVLKYYVELLFAWSVAKIYHIHLKMYVDYILIWLIYSVYRHFQQYFSYIVTVSFIGGGNRSTRRKSPTCRKSPTNFIIYYIIYSILTSAKHYIFYLRRVWRYQMGYQNPYIEEEQTT